MRCVVRQVTEERLLLISLDEIDGCIGKQIGHIAPGFDGLSVHDYLIGIGIAFNVPMIMSEEMIEASTMWLILRIPSQVPFSKQSRLVTGFLQELRNRRFTLPECVSPKAGIVQPGPQIMPPCHQPGPGRCTNHVRIETREGNTLACQPLDRRRFDVWITGDLRIPVTLIVGHDQNNIRLPGFFVRLQRLRPITDQTTDNEQ